MPFYFRKSFGRGPFRLNLSGRGVGVSVGVKGFRVGTGPRGAYVRAGRGGFYYQQYLSAPPRRSPPPLPGEAPPPPTSEQLIQGKPIEFVGDVQTSPDDFVAEINRRRAEFRWSGLGIACSVLFSFVAAINHLPVIVYGLLLAVLVGSIILRVHENRLRSIDITYNLDQRATEVFDLVLTAFREASTASRIWRLTTKVDVSDAGKRHAGATQLVDRSVTRIQFNGPDVKTNFRIPFLQLQSARLYFLPDRILMIRGLRVMSLKYEEVEAVSGISNFRETDPKPQDATLVGTTWAYVNKNGTPDKRFSNNRQIPIFEYSELSVKHPQLSMVLQFSRKGVAVPLASALRALACMRTPTL